MDSIKAIEILRANWSFLFVGNKSLAPIIENSPTSPSPRISAQQSPATGEGFLPSVRSITDFAANYAATITYRHPLFFAQGLSACGARTELGLGDASAVESGASICFACVPSVNTDAGVSPPTCNLQIAPSGGPTDPGQDLSWWTTNATSVSLLEGRLDGGLALPLSTSPNGRLHVIALPGTCHTLTATGPGGTCCQSSWTVIASNPDR